jgi:nucleoside phosphorylase
MTDGSSAAKIDVLILTAVKVEYDAALLVATGAWPGSTWTRETGPTGLEVAFRTFRSKDGQPMRVALTRALEMGGVATASAAGELITHYKPRYLAMCGGCAGRRGEVELGDVIVADRLWTYDTGKLEVEVDEQGNRHERVQGDLLPYLIDPVWQQQAEGFEPDDAEGWLAKRPRAVEAQEDWLLERRLRGEEPYDHADREVRCADYGKVLEQLWKKKFLRDGALTLTDAGRTHIQKRRMLHPGGSPEAAAFTVHVGPIGTGSRVVEDPEIFERLSEHMRKVLGLEMEASAIGAIAHLEGLRMVVMKGVMDFADPAKDDNFKAFAARASAECLVAFLRANLKP